MDLGGASTQLVFHHQSPTSDSSKTEQIMFGDLSQCVSQQYLRGLGKLRLYAVSRLGYGVNEFFRSVVSQWEQTEGAAAQQGSNPCLFRGASQDHSIEYEGTGDFAACRSLVSSILRTENAALVCLSALT